MDKKEQKTIPKTQNPRGASYSKEIKMECVKLLKEGLSVDEVVVKLDGPKERAVKRYAKKFNFEIKN